MRNSSKERLAKLHQMLDKELDQDNLQENNARPPQPQHRKKQKSAFQHLRYSSNLKIDNDENDYLSKQNQRSHVSSLLKKSLQKNQKYKKQLSQNKKSFACLSSSEQQTEKQINLNKNSMRGSRHSQINQLQKKLMNLQKKMQNIGISSSESEEQQEINLKINNKPKQKYKSEQKQIQQKKSLNSLLLRQNQVEYKRNLAQNRFKTNLINDGTARFCNNQDEMDNKKDQKINLPLSHRQNYHEQSEQQDSNSDDLEFKYQKFTNINKQKKQKKVIIAKDLSSEQDDQQQIEQKVNKKNFQNKPITHHMEKLIIVEKEEHKNIPPKIQLIKQKKNFVVKQKQTLNKFSTINSNPDRKFTLEHEILEPRFTVENRKNKQKQKQKKSISKTGSHKNIFIEKNKSLSKKKLDQQKQKKNIKYLNIQMKPSKNLNHSFISQNSAKSQRSANSLVSHGSKRSLSRNDGQNLNNNLVKQKQFNKKIDNLEKDLQHYKRLAKRYQNEISQYKLLQIQYKKLQTQFKKSEQIRFQQKKIIQNFRNRSLNM